MLEVYMRFGLENPNTYRLTFCSSPGQISAIRHEVAADLGARCYDRFMSAVADIASEGRLRVGDADSAAHTLWAACHGLVSLSTGGHKRTDRVDDKTMMALMLDSLFHGLVID
jgi:hypothetical protein